jgi:HSP20 family molecular chaperone IbpA
MSAISNDYDNKKTDEITIIYHEDTIYSESEATFSEFIHWQPLYDLFIFGDDIIVTIELPGVASRDFAVHVYKHHIFIRGKRKSTEVLAPECCTFHNIEIPYGLFYRRIDLPAPIELGKCVYKLEHGILHLKFPVVKERVIPIEG